MVPQPEQFTQGTGLVPNIEPRPVLPPFIDEPSDFSKMLAVPPCRCAGCLG